MSKLIKIAVILAVAAVAIAAKQIASPTSDTSALSMVPAASISPSEITRRVGHLPEQQIENLY